MFLLGAVALKSMVDNEASRPLVFPGSYYQAKKNLLDIQNLNVNPDTIHVYRYVMKPNLPIYRDSPKRPSPSSLPFFSAGSSVLLSSLAVMR